MAAPRATFVLTNLKTALATARFVRAKHPEFRLVVTVPGDASEEDRNWVRQIANHLPPGSM
jgi:Na+-translocating ferredoxin:NAD+ oxidoreductase RnfC subunit